MPDHGEATIEALFNDAAPHLFAHALLLSSGDRGTAEDLVQLAFQALIKDWSTLSRRSPDLLRGWLFRTVQNLAISAYRKQRRTLLVDPNMDAAVFDAAHHSPDLDRGLLAKDLLEACWAVVSTMPPERRLVIILHAYGAKTTEIAERLGIAPSTVRGHRSNALREIINSVGYAVDVLDDIEGDLEGAKP